MIGEPMLYSWRPRNWRSDSGVIYDLIWRGAPRGMVDHSFNDGANAYNVEGLLLGEHLDVSNAKQLVVQAAQKPHVYVAGKVGRGLEGVQELMAELRGRGYIISYDWTKDSAETPYLQFRDQWAPLSEKMLRGAGTSDVFVLMADDRAYGAMVEFGAALEGHRRRHPKRIYVVGSNLRQSAFFALPEVAVLDAAEAVLEQLPRL
jgi:hypothetical protein